MQDILALILFGEGYVGDEARHRQPQRQRRRRVRLGEAMSRIKFDPTWNFGHVLQAFIFVAATVGAYYTMRSDVALIDLRLQGVERGLTSIANLIVTDARQEERINGLVLRMDRLEQAQRPR